MAGYVIISSVGDRAEADTLDAALAAAQTLLRDCRYRRQATVYVSVPEPERLRPVAEVFGYGLRRADHLEGRTA
jgi:hypothetical protein